MASGAWHVHPRAGGMTLCGCSNLLLQHSIHHGWLDRCTIRGDRHGNGSCTVGSGGKVMDRLLKVLQEFHLWVAILQDHFCFAWDNAGCPWVKGDAANRPYSFWPGDGLKGVPQLIGEIDQGHPGIFAVGHGRSAGVILLSTKEDLATTDAYNRGNHTEFILFRLQVWSLLDMPFEVANIALPLQPYRGNPVKPCSGQGLSQELAIGVGRGSNGFLGECATKRAAPKAPEIGTFFIGPGHCIHWEMPSDCIFSQGADNFDAVGNAQRAVQPPPTRLGIGMRANQQRLAALARASNDVTHSINTGVKSRGGHLRTQPAACSHIWC